jgi:hypothetical protein
MLKYSLRILPALAAVITVIIVPLGQAQSVVPPSFFGVSSVSANDMPQITYGFLGHGFMAWPFTEKCRPSVNPVDPTDPCYSWTGLDKYVNAAASAGLVDANGAVLTNIVLGGGTPAWAVTDQSTCKLKSGVNICTIPPDNIQDWANYVTAFMAHYNGVVMPHVKFLEVWNEANNSQFWSSTYAALAALAQVAYPIVHRDPYTQLLTPSVAGPVNTSLSIDGGIWMTGYLNAGGAAYADGGTFHGYGATTAVRPYPWPEDSKTQNCTATTCYSSIASKVTTFRSIFDQNGLSGKPIYDTEGSWGNANVTDPDQQVAWGSRWLILQAGLSASTNLQTATWYAWGTGQSWGTIENAGGTPTTAGAALSQVYDWLAGKSVSACGNTGTIWTCSVSGSSGYEAEVIWDSSQSCSGGVCTTRGQTVGAQYIKYRDLAGGSFLINNHAVPVGIKPVILENQ